MDQGPRRIAGGLHTLELPGHNPLKDAHAALDAAVLAAYGFSAKKDLLGQLLALNLEVARRIDPEGRSRRPASRPITPIPRDWSPPIACGRMNERPSRRPAALTLGTGKSMSVAFRSAKAVPFRHWRRSFAERKATPIPSPILTLSQRAVPPHHQEISAPMTTPCLIIGELGNRCHCRCGRGRGSPTKPWI